MPGGISTACSQCLCLHLSTDDTAGAGARRGVRACVRACVACGMPAPQAFLGAAVSLGVGVAAYHIYQNKAIAHEEEEARKERDKLAQDRRERAEQRRQKEGFEAEQRSYVGYMMAQEKESLLLEDLLHDVYDAVARTCESRPSVNLPLLRLRGSPDSPAEAALGVGLLLGMESHHVERVVKDLSKSCLRWLAAGRLTCKSLVACAEALEAGPVTLGVPKQYLAALDKDSISAFLSLVFHASSSTGPVIHWLKCYTATNVVGIRDLASHLGVLALPWAWFEPARVGPQDEFISFRPGRFKDKVYDSHTMQGLRNRFAALDASSAYYSLGGNDQGIALFNFDPCNGFSFRIEERTAGGACRYRAGEPLPLRSATTQRRHRQHEELSALALFPRDVTKGSLFLAQLNVFCLTKVGARRLRELAKRASTEDEPSDEPQRVLSARGVSLEHLLAISGDLDTISGDLDAMEAGLLPSLRTVDMDLVIKRREEITAQLAAGLRKVLLAPYEAPLPSNGTPRTARPLVEEPCETVIAQIDAFVPLYVELLRIRLSHVPCLSDGSYPHEVVAPTPLMVEAKGHYLAVPTAPQARRAADLLRADEHLREVEMRNLGTLPFSYTIAVTVTYGLLLISMCYGVLHASLTRFPGTASPRLLCLLALAFAAWTHHCNMRIICDGFCGHGFCDLAKGDSDTEAANRLLSSSYDALGRCWIGRQLGWRTALERVLEPLEVRCQATLHVWLARLARRRYFEAVHRKRIGRHEVAALLEDLFTADLFTASEQARKAAKKGRSSSGLFFWRHKSSRNAATRQSSIRRTQQQPKSPLSQRRKQRRELQEEKVPHVKEEMPQLSALKALETATSSTSLREALLDAVKYRDCTTFAEALPRARQRLKELLRAEAEEEEGNDDSDDDHTVNLESVRLPGTLQEAEAFLSLPVYDEGADEEPAAIDVRARNASIEPRRPPPTADAMTCVNNHPT